MGICATKPAISHLPELPSEVWDLVVDHLCLSAFASLAHATSVLLVLPATPARRIRALRAYHTEHMLEPIRVGYEPLGHGYGTWRCVRLLRGSYVRVGDAAPAQWMPADSVITADDRVWVYAPHCEILSEDTTPGW